MMDHIDNLEDVDFTRFIFSTVQPIIVELIDKEKRLEYSTSSLTKQESYVMDTAGALAQVIGAYEQLQFALAFITNFRATPATRRLRISRFDYLIYHLENFYIRLVTVFDRTLILVDQVFDLGNHPRSIKWNVISNNHHVRISSMYISLNKFNKFIDPYRYPRNLIVHERGHLPEEEAFERLSLFYQVAWESDGTIPDYFIKRATDQAVSDKLTQLGTLKSLLRSHLLATLSALLPEFEKRLRIASG